MIPRRKWTLRISAVAAVAAVSAKILLGCVDSSVTQPYEAKDLTLEEIREKLASKDFKEKLEAKKQIDKLEPEERVRILLALAQDRSPATRIIAAQKLRALDDPRAKTAVARLAQEDPDPTVREVAAGKP